MILRAPGYAVSPSSELLNELRRQSPLVQCITNAVVTNMTANVLLAIGAAPAMVDVPGEAAEFAAVASGLLVNLGTPHGEQRLAAVEAAESATIAGTPWVLDPVAIGMLPVRTRLAHDLLSKHPTVVRGNASEMLALAGQGSGGRGVDAVDSADDAAEAARHLATTYRTVVAVSGPVDLVTDGQRTVRVHTGSPLLTRVTGGGCALGALMAAFMSLTGNALEAAVAATSAYTVAASLAAEEAAGPGSFAVALLDRLGSLDADTLASAEVLS